MTSINDCLVLVSEEFGIALPRLLGEQRARSVARPRQVAMWLAKHATAKSLPQIARSLQRDHTTIMHGIRTVDRLRECDTRFREVTSQLLVKVLAA